MAKKKTRKKLVLVGDQGCGKTFLLFRYVDNVYPEKTKPVTFGERIVSTRIGTQTVLLHLCDTDGHPYYQPHRKYIYSKAHVVLMCVPIDNPESIENITRKWAPEVDRHCPSATIVLIGTKKDMRTRLSVFDFLNDDEMECIDSEEWKDETKSTSYEQKKSITGPMKYQHGESLARRIGAFGYWECSAKTGEGVREVFRTAARISMRHKSTCMIF